MSPLRLLLALACLLGVPSLASALPNFRGWCEVGAQPVVLSGLSSSTQVQASYPLCTVAVYLHGGGLAPNVYSDNGVTITSNPFTAGINGQWIFYVPNGRYDVTMSGVGMIAPVTYSDVIISDASGGGGGGVSIFSAGQLTPLFTTVVSNASSTPNLAFTLSVAGAHAFFGNNLAVPSLPAYLQPAFTDLLGTLGCPQMPALSGVITSVAGSCVTSGSTGITNLTTSGNASAFMSVPVTNPTTTPNIAFNLNAAPALTVWGNCTAGLLAPSYCLPTSAMLPQSVRRHTCMITVGADNGSVLVDADIGPQGDQCLVPIGSTVIEIGVVADGGTPSVTVSRDRLGTVANLLTAPLAAAAGTVNYKCANTTGTTSINGVTACSGTLQNVALISGDYINVLSGTAGGTAKKLSIAVVWLVN